MELHGRNSSFAEHMIQYYLHLRTDWPVPESVEVIDSIRHPETMGTLSTFYRRFLAEPYPRVGLFGINPGRFGAGQTGVQFTDPVQLEQVLGIESPFAKRSELSSTFVYRVIAGYGGPRAFFRDFYLSCLCPLGFTRQGKNCNFYDLPELRRVTEPWIVEHIQTQLDAGLTSRVAICLGRGRNIEVFEELNQAHGFFQRILVLPHPRWVMQYRRSKLDDHLREYLDCLKDARCLLPG